MGKSDAAHFCNLACANCYLDRYGDDFEHQDNGYNHEELVHAAIDDLNDDPSHASEIFKHALTELSTLRKVQPNAWLYRN